jgi:segregation and condensation protein B
VKELGILEGILFVMGDEGVDLKTICSIMNITETEAKSLLMELKKNYESADRGLRISFLGEAFKLTTKQEHKEYYEKLVTDSKTTNLSNAALEVLAIIAYNEPVTRLEIDDIRGVNSSQIIRRLLARGLIKTCGKADNIGKPNLYKTTNDFLDYFGLSSKDDLPDIIYESREENDNGDLYESRYTEEK